jgi:competence protein ComEA
MSILAGTPQGKILEDGEAARADVAAAWLAVSRSSKLPAREPANLHAPPTPSTSASAPGEDPEPLSSGITKDGKVVLNCASAEELTRLPGVGEKRSADIVALRERLGKFKRPTDLLRVRGIGPKSLQKMKPYFILDPPEDSGTKDKGKRQARKSERAED